MHALDAEEDSALLRRKVEEEAMGLSVGELKNGEETRRERQRDRETERCLLR